MKYIYCLKNPLQKDVSFKFGEQQKRQVSIKQNIYVQIPNILNLVPTQTKLLRNILARLIYIWRRI